MQVQWLWSSCMTLTNQYFNTSDWLEVKVKVDLSMEELFKGCISKTCCTTWCDIMVIIQPSQSTPKHRCIALNTYLGYCQLCTKCQYYNTACFIACYLVICLCGDLDLSSDKTFDSRLFSNVLILQKASRNRVIVACCIIVLTLGAKLTVPQVGVQSYTSMLRCGLWWLDYHHDITSCCTTCFGNATFEKFFHRQVNFDLHF